MFAAISGSSPATAATIGTVAIPELKKRGYDTNLTLGSLACAGTLGILIPPSINFIIYGVLTSTSVGTLFIAGIVPGIMLTLMFMIYIAIRVSINPELAPKGRIIFSPKILIQSVMNLWPLIVLVVIVLGGIFSGLMTPTESAAVGSISALLITLILRKLSWQLIRTSLLEALKTSSMVLLIIAGAFIFAAFLGRARVPATISAYVADWPTVLILLSICLVYLVLGCFIAPGEIMIITIPSILPILQNIGIDLIWFGVIVVVLCEIGMITPPMGLNLFIIQGISGEDLQRIVRGSIPFFIIMLFAIVVMWLFPSIAVWLPSLMMNN
jgi:tripartite ATP-independent transporter DctM subunit